MEPGDPLPPLRLPDAAGGVIVLDSAAAPLVVYFYPRDDTPGCTTEAKDFTALLPAFAALGIRVVGISRDSPAKHARFAARHDLTVELASDEDGTACAAFSTWVEKSLYGRKYMGLERATFLFGRDARLARVWRGAKVKGHAAEVLAAARTL